MLSILIYYLAASSISMQKKMKGLKWNMPFFKKKVKTVCFKLSYKINGED